MAQTVEAKQVVLKDSEGGYLLPYAGVAQKALKDNDGNDIPTTYAKRADLNGYLPVDGKAVDSAKPTRLLQRPLPLKQLRIVPASKLTRLTSKT